VSDFGFVHQNVGLNIFSVLRSYRNSDESAAKVAEVRENLAVFLAILTVQESAGSPGLNPFGHLMHDDNDRRMGALRK
jgi:hypothetical protein